MTSAAITIVLDPQLGITPDQFAAAWNSQPETANHGQARVETANSSHYDLSAFTAEVILVSLAINLATNLIWKVIEAASPTKPAPGPRPHIQEITQPDGTRLLIITLPDDS